MGALRHSDRYDEKTDKKSVNARTMIRRMVVGLTNAALWALEATADEKDTDVEVFSNVGFYSRPRDDSDAEAVVVKIGASTRHSAIIATRDEKLRQLVVEARDLIADESILFNSLAVCYVKADGTIEAKSAGGTAVELCLKTDLEALQDAIADVVISPTDGGLTIKVAVTAVRTAGNPVGTTVLKGE